MTPQQPILLGFILMMMLAGPHLARGQSSDHQHPAADSELHDKFYATWKIPNGGRDRISSCCNKLDCYPATVRKRDNGWVFQRREDGAWVPIPNHLIEQNQTDPRESPDDRSHVCASRDRVFCFTFGAGN